MSRKWAVFAVTAGLVAGLGALRSRAADDGKEKSPLAKIMVKVEAETKAIGDVTASAAKFKKTGAERIGPAAEKLVEYGKETRKFTEPAEAQKQPIAKWNAMTDEYIAASEKMSKAAKKGELRDLRKAMTDLNKTCTNCHGAFRPKTGDDF